MNINLTGKRAPRLEIKRKSAPTYLGKDIYDALVVMPFSNTKHEIKMIWEDLKGKLTKK
jgi:hypothetical protein